MTETLEANQQMHNLDTVAQGAGSLAIASEMDPQLDRAAEVARLIDPEHTLPVVELVSTPTRMQKIARGTITDMDYVVMHNGVKVGGAIIVTDKAASERYFSRIVINERGKGLGMSAYREAITDSMLDGYSFRTANTSQSGESAKIWEKLAAKGVARVVEPFKRFKEDGKSMGHYVVDVAKA